MKSAWTMEDVKRANDRAHAGWGRGSPTPHREVPAGHNITPVPKPRMTRRDVWLHPPRPAVKRYREFADQCRIARLTLPDADAHVLFVLPMPESWSTKKKGQMDGTPHQAKPDLSNLLKALEDAVHPHDERIWRYGSIRKIWGRYGRIEIS